MKKGIIISIDVLIASLIVIMFITTFFFYDIDSNIHEKIKSDRISDILFVLEDELKSGDQDLIETGVSDMIPKGWEYHVVVDYYGTDGLITDTIVFGDDLSEIVAIDRRGFVVADESDVTGFGIAEMRVGR
jgi:hypothetical protein